MTVDQSDSRQVLFSERTAAREGPLGWTEPSVNFLLESTRPIAAVGRSNVNKWYSRFPDIDGKFGARLISQKGVDHQTALDELLLHEMLTAKALVIYEEGGRGPDFRLYAGRDYLGAVEMMSLFMEEGFSNTEARHGRIADELNSRLSLDRWFVHFEVDQLDRSPSARKLADWVSGEITQLPNPEASDARTHHRVYSVDGVRLNFSFYPCKPDPTGKGGRIVGPGPIIGGWIKSGERLRVALTGKAGRRYELREKPFAVCVGIHDPFCSVDQIEAALYGNVQYEVATMNHSRADKAFFGRKLKLPKRKE